MNSECGKGGRAGNLRCIYMVFTRGQKLFSWSKKQQEIQKARRKYWNEVNWNVDGCYLEGIKQGEPGSFLFSLIFQYFIYLQKLGACTVFRIRKSIKREILWVFLEHEIVTRRNYSNCILSQTSIGSLKHLKMQEIGAYSPGRFCYYTWDVHTEIKLSLQTLHVLKV